MEYRSFTRRHIGSNDHEIRQMLTFLGYKSMEELIQDTVPENILIEEDLDVSRQMTEYEYLHHAGKLAAKNKVFRSFIGQGYYNTVSPSVILRNVFENPGWYTSYTPYQAEIAQGRLEAMLNFQTMVMDLTGMSLANASLLDESTAAAEAMLMFFALRSRKEKKENVNKFFVDNEVFTQTKNVLTTRAEALDIELTFGDYAAFTATEGYFGALVQYPNAQGEIKDYRAFAESMNSKGVKTAVSADLLSLSILEEPGQWGVDCVVGTTQRFGIPIGFGGPHAAFFATKEEYKRHIPGRIIGVSKDSNGNNAYRMALQTREQHIKREKATSNICTAQALLASMAGFYGAYHGGDGLKSIAMEIHRKTSALANHIKSLGLSISNEYFFDTITLPMSNSDLEKLKEIAESHGVNFYFTDNECRISLDETVLDHEMDLLFDIFLKFTDSSSPSLNAAPETNLPQSLLRKTAFLEHPVFKSYHSETEMMRYIRRLENKDLSLVHSMISLGSCTMKLNAASEMLPLSNPNFSEIHPLAPEDQTQGYLELIANLERDLAHITGFAGLSFQPNSGAQGEYTGLMVIRAYHHARGDDHRTVCLIPSSAHGTNPASAVMAGMQVIIVKSMENGNIDVEDLKSKAEQYKDNLAALMVTYPSTHGVFESEITDIIDIIHENGGQVYMDGANMNAQVGLTSPGKIGADVCHLNLHKTFAIPHGGGGPGMGPIGVAKHLLPYLPKHPVYGKPEDEGIEAVSASHFGSGLILPISYGYIKMLGRRGLLKSTEVAILNANYLKKRLQEHYDILYTGERGNVGHEMIVDFRGFKEHGIEVEDVAKRLIDYGFHAPTVSFPVPGTMMIEPTESESREELDRFADAMLSIREEINEVAIGQADRENNVLKNAPHTLGVITANEWDRPYSREKAAFPLPYLRDSKFWSSVGRVDNAYGDRNLVCSCLPIEAYESDLNPISF
jgi:glycine dehydrogenase